MQHIQTAIGFVPGKTSSASDEQALLIRVTGLEDEIEQLEGVRARLQQVGRSSTRFNQTLRDLRRERASCLYALLG